MVWGEGWHVGVIGLAAGRLCQQYACPACVLSLEDGWMHGSLRSIPGVNIHRCLQQCDDLLERYGGHEQAAGVTLKLENYEAFRQRLQQAVRDSADESCFIPAQEYDAEVRLQDCTAPLLDEISLLAPFGCQNPAPLLLARGLCPEGRRAVGADGSHLKLALRQDQTMMDGIAFGMGRLASSLPDRVDAVFSLGRNTFRGVTRLQLEVKALEPDRQARRQALRQPGEDLQGLLGTLMDELEHPQGQPALERDWADVQTALAAAPRGCLLAAHTPQTAARALALGDLDFCTQTPKDVRGFATVVLNPLPSLAEGCFRQVWLLDGALCLGEADLWRSRFPKAQVYALPVSPELKDAARRLDAGDDGFRRLYRVMRAWQRYTLQDLCRESGLLPPQARLGLEAFRQLKLAEYTASPFRYALLDAVKCRLGDSPILRTLRALQGGDD